MSSAKKSVGTSAESGQSLLELLVSVPVILLLLVSIGGSFLWLMRLYALEAGEWELQNELRIAAERISGDMAYAKRIECITIGGNEQIIIEPYDRSLTEPVTYFVHTENHTRRIVRNRSNQPITGESDLGRVDITGLHCRKLGGREGLFRLEVTGRSLLTGSSFALGTAVFVPHMGEVSP